MFKNNIPNDSIHLYVNEISSRVVAKSGIPTDRFHLGKLLLQCLKDAPDFVMQIDAANGQSETNASALKRTVKCANGLKKLGFKTGDVMVLMGPNNLDLCIPFFAALYLGVASAGLDSSYSVSELIKSFTILKPSVIFCPSTKTSAIQQALDHLKLKSFIVTFEKGNAEYVNFEDFLNKYGHDESVEDFRPSDFNTEETYAFLIGTSGTSGFPKSAALTYKNFAISLPYWGAHFTEFPTPTRMQLMCSTIAWMTAYMVIIHNALFRVTRLQTSLPPTTDHVHDILGKYKPTCVVISPTLMTTLIKYKSKESLDLSYFEHIYMGGSSVSQDLIDEVQALAPNALVLAVYGMTEIAMAFQGTNTKRGSVGRPIGYLKHKLIDPVSEVEIKEVHVSGELLVKGPTVIKKYYKNPEATREAFTKDGWFRTGDIFYRDEEWNFFFVERLKLMLKYKSFQISPVEIETVIRQHPDVIDVAVTGIEDAECGDLPVACVIRRNSNVSAQEIKLIVERNLSDAKKLRGGVIFVTELPLTASAKINRNQLKKMVVNMKRE